VNPSAPFIGRPVATTLLTIGVALAGFFAFLRLPVAAPAAGRLPDDYGEHEYAGGGSKMAGGNDPKVHVEDRAVRRRVLDQRERLGGGVIGHLRRREAERARRAVHLRDR
jgi:hypothetical protein